MNDTDRPGPQDAPPDPACIQGGGGGAVSKFAYINRTKLIEIGAPSMEMLMMDPRLNRIIRDAGMDPGRAIHYYYDQEHQRVVLEQRR